MKEVEEPEQKPSPPKKPLIFYYCVALIVLMLLNALFFPSVLERQVYEVPYSQFLTMVDNDQVSQVALDEDSREIIFIGTDENGREGYYKTGVWPDDGQRLLNQLREDPDIVFTAEIPTQANPILSFLVSWILPIFFFLLIGQLLSRFMMKRMGGGMPGGMGNAMTFGKANAKIYVEEASTGVSFADVAGQDEAKDALMEVVDFLHNPQKYAEIGAKLPKGVLLVGPPGTGKTLLAKAVAGEAKVPFFSISGSEFVEMFVGMGAAKVRDLFKQANEKAPCIVFIDENQLLAEMDGFDSSKGVVLLAATNRPESLDPALMRPGRFDRRVRVELPDLQGRVAILKVHGKHVHIDGDVDWDAIARATAGASGAELANIVNEGALRAVRQGRKTVTQADLEESVETVIAGAQRKNAVISPEEKKLVSYHEVGHALVAALQTHSAQRHRAGHQAGPGHDHPLRYDRAVRHGGPGDGTEPVPGRRHLPDLLRRDRRGDRQAGGGHCKGRPPEGPGPVEGPPGPAPQAGGLSAGEGDHHRRGVHVPAGGEIRTKNSAPQCCGAEFCHRRESSFHSFCWLGNIRRGGVRLAYRRAASCRRGGGRKATSGWARPSKAAREKAMLLSAGMG